MPIAHRVGSYQHDALDCIAHRVGSYQQTQLIASPTGWAPTNRRN